jgi:molecular chaperone IbpA|tara:strand:- start:472 stop:918 length:447 start_codon:yes stop_codon:yes gene_type:complete
MTRTLSLRSLDIPSIHKFGIGFDSMLDEMLRVSTQSNQTNYPPYNIVKETEDKFRIEVATAGFNEGEVKIELDNRVLTINGSKENQEVYTDEYLFQGISNRDFQREFTLAEHVKIIDATNVNGILTIYLERQVPEEMKPKTIDIKYLK